MTRVQVDHSLTCSSATLFRGFAGFCKALLVGTGLKTQIRINRNNEQGFFSGRSILIAQHKLLKSWSENGVFLCARKNAEAPRKHFFAEGLAEAHVFRNFNRNLEALNEVTKMLSGACLRGTIHASYPKSISGHTTFAEGPRKVRGSPKCKTGSTPTFLLLDESSDSSFSSTSYSSSSSS